MSHLNRNQRVKPTAVLLIKALALGLVLIFIGCESEPPQKAAPTVVRKKIVPSNPSAGAQKANAVKKNAPKPAQAATTAKAAAAPLPVLSSAKGQVQASSQPAQSSALKPAPAPKAASDTDSGVEKQSVQMASAT
ncbi:MAG: hypothetical protein PVG78_10855, partial [Desulfobacterales bacterium]